MTEITCFTCGAKCTEIWKEPKETGHVYYECRLKALPQPDLTKLREIFEGFKEHWINRWLFLNHEQCLEELMLAIKKVLDVKGIGKL